MTRNEQEYPNIVSTFFESTGMSVPYICTNLGCGIPDFDDLDIPSHKNFALPLLPVEDKTGIFVAWYQVRQRSKC